MQTVWYYRRKHYKIKVLENGKLDEEETSILLSNIKKAKLVLTDELIKASQER